MKTFTKKSFVAVLLPALLFAGCARRNESTVGTPANPLNIVVSPAHAPKDAAALDAIKKQLESSTGMTIVITQAATPADTIKAFDAGKTDVGLVTLEEYLVAREEYGVHATLQALRENGLSDYQGVILTKAKGGPVSVAELAGKKVGFVGPYSVSGFTLPVSYLNKAGVKVQPVFAASHEEVLKMLVDGKVDAAATYARQVKRAPGLKVLAYTGTVPNEPLITRDGLTPEKTEAVKKAFAELASTPQGAKALSAVADITGFKPVDSEVYRPIHDLLRSEGKSVYDMVPDGWDIYHLNQPFMPER